MSLWLHALVLTVRARAGRTSHRTLSPWPRRGSPASCCVATSIRHCAALLPVFRAALAVAPGLPLPLCLLLRRTFLQSGSQLAGKWNRRWVTLTKKSLCMFAERMVPNPPCLPRKTLSMYYASVEPQARCKGRSS